LTPSPSSILASKSPAGASTALGGMRRVDRHNKTAAAAAVWRVTAAFAGYAHVASQWLLCVMVSNHFSPPAVPEGLRLFTSTTRVVRLEANLGDSPECATCNATELRQCK
jgi:hypothetical protein